MASHGDPPRRGARAPVRLALPVLLLVLLALRGPLCAQPAEYSAAEIRGRVADPETKQPLDGVHVVAQWILNTGLFFHSRRVTRLQILETQTNAQGEYHLPPWGPKPRPPLATLDWGSDPILTFFKPGYRPLDRNNYSPPPEDEASRSLRVSRWSGRTVDLEPFRGSPEEWIRALSGLQIRLAWAAETDHPVPTINDNWKHMPEMVLAVAEQRRLLPERLRPGLRTLDAWRTSEAELHALVRQKGPSP